MTKSRNKSKPAEPSKAASKSKDISKDKNYSPINTVPADKPKRGGKKSGL